MCCKWSERLVHAQMGDTDVDVKSRQNKSIGWDRCPSDFKRFLVKMNHLRVVARQAIRQNDILVRNRWIEMIPEVFFGESAIPFHATPEPARTFSTAAVPSQCDCRRARKRKDGHEESFARYAAISHSAHMAQRHDPSLSRYKVWSTGFTNSHRLFTFYRTEKWYASRTGSLLLSETDRHRKDTRMWTTKSRCQCLVQTEPQSDRF